MLASVKMTADAARPAPWRDDWGEVVLRLLVGGGRSRGPHSVRGAGPLAVPGFLKRALDRLSGMCIAAGDEPPRSVADLLRWCQRPLGERAIAREFGGYVREHDFTGLPPMRLSPRWVSMAASRRRR